MDFGQAGILIGIARAVPATAGAQAVTAQLAAEAAQEAAETAAANAATHNYGISVDGTTLEITPPEEGSDD